MANDKMSKKIKFALIMDGDEVRTWADLQMKFSLEDLLDDFMDCKESDEIIESEEGEKRKIESKLCEWLTDRYLFAQAAEIEEQQRTWLTAEQLKPEEKTKLICEIQNVFLPENLPPEKRKKKQTDEIIKADYDILTKKEFDDRLERVKKGINDNDGTKYDEDKWRKYLSRLAWDDDSLQELIDSKVNKIYLLQRDGKYRLPLRHFNRIMFEGITDKNGRMTEAEVIEDDGSAITSENWNRYYKNNKITKSFKNIKIYIEGKEQSENNDTTIKSTIVGSSGNSEAEARKKLARYMDAQYPLIYLKTYEEDKADEIIRDTAGGKRILEWSIEGFFDKGVNTECKVNERDFGLYNALHLLIRQCDSRKNTDENKEIFMHNAVLVLKDVHELKDENPITAQLKYLAQLIYKGELEDCNIIIVSPVLSIPKAIENYVMNLDFSHLSTEEIQSLIDEFCQGQNPPLEIKDEVRPYLVEALRGLSEFQIVNILGLAYAGDGYINKDDLKQITDYKKQIIRKDGILDIADVKVEKKDIGGLEELKKWLEGRSTIIEKWDKAKEKGVAMPKGILIAGMPGCGKSLCAKAAVTILWKSGEVPLLRMDMGRIMGKYVGESEENMRRALRQADAIAPCVLWIDEIEKGFAGVGGGGDGAEVTTRLFGSFLTWMQERTSLIFVVATANNIEILPPELLRKGRFDEVYYIDLPNMEERKKIFEIYIKKEYEEDLAKIIKDEGLTKLAKATDGYSGAEIEGIVRESIAKLFIDNNGNNDAHLTVEHILNVKADISSLQKMRPETITKLRNFYQKHDFKNASELDSENQKEVSLFGKLKRTGNALYEIWYG